MEFFDFLSRAFGLDVEVQDLDVMQMVLRACMAFFFTLLVIKGGKRRFMSKAAAFDVVMAIILGSVISRAVNGSAPVLPTLAASVALMPSRSRSRRHGPMSGSARGPTATSRPSEAMHAAASSIAVIHAAAAGTTGIA